SHTAIKVSITCSKVLTSSLNRTISFCFTISSSSSNSTDCCSLVLIIFKFNPENTLPKIHILRQPNYFFPDYFQTLTQLPSIFQRLRKCLPYKNRLRGVCHFHSKN